jgi:DNA-binding LytR/AlgR family response regulator
MKRPTVVIAEDERVLRAEIRETLLAIWPEIEICAEAETGLEALAAFERFKPAILLLDIEMPGMSGLEVARQASGQAHIAFITAHNQHAVAAFERGAVDYLLKPISSSRLALTVGRLKDRLQGVPAELGPILELLTASATLAKRYLRWISVTRGEEIQLITVEEICYFRSTEKYTTVVTASGEYLITTALKVLCEQLDPETFVKVHRGILVNLNAIRSLHRSLSGGLEIRLKKRSEILPVSAAHAAFFKQVSK